MKNTIQKYFSLILITKLLLFSTAFAQNLDYTKSVVATLCSDEFAGRGYVENGAQKAAIFIAEAYKKAGLQSFTPNYIQDFGYPAVAFPFDLLVQVDGNALEAGVDYIVGSGCPKLSGIFDLVYADSVTLDNPTIFSKFEKSSFYKSMIVLDELKNKKLKHPERLEKILKNGYNCRGLIFANQKKLTWSVSTEWDKAPTLYVLGDKIKSTHKRIKIDIQPELRAHQAENIIGFIKGSHYPDSFIVISAHYDHLGKLGKNAYFRGANDNASGVAMMLDMMQYYKENKPRYSIAFIAFAGEEAGLFGSYYYTQNPLFPLNQISVLINLDLMGTGDEGMMVVNGEIFRDEFIEISLLNSENNLLPEIKARGKAANSDHYYFSENGVKAFFFYLMGKYNFYHDVGDTPEALTYSKYNEAFQIIKLYINQNME
jgi:hypothetical protein